MTLVRTAAALMAATFALGALAAGNTTNEDFRDSKKMLERKVYFDHRVTLYCGYAFDKQKNVSLPAGFVAPQHKERAAASSGSTSCPPRTSAAPSRSGAKGTVAARMKRATSTRAVAAPRRCLPNTA